CGTIVALRRDEHMRLTIIVGSVGPRWGDRLNAIAALVVIAFVLEILLPAQEYLGQQSFVELVALHISDSYRVTALLVGFALAAVIALLRLLETQTVRGFLLALAVVAAVAGALWVAQPLLIAM